MGTWVTADHNSAGEYNPSLPFNTPIESGLRSLWLLHYLNGDGSDLSRLVVYDYLLVHSSDVPGGPESIHPATPYRSGELLVRRNLIQRGLMLMVSKELATIHYDESGIKYCRSILTGRFLVHLESPYSRKLQSVAQWVVHTFNSYSDTKLRAFVNTHLGQWGAEFERASSLWEEEK